MPAKKGIGIWDTGPAKPKSKTPSTRVSVGPVTVTAGKVAKKPPARRPPTKRAMGPR